MMLISLQKYILKLYVFAKFWRVRSTTFAILLVTKFKLGLGLQANYRSGAPWGGLLNSSHTFVMSKYLYKSNYLFHF